MEDKLVNLKDQLVELRSAIKSFETEFDERLDACLQQVRIRVSVKVMKRALQV